MALFNRLTGATYATHLTLVKPGDVVTVRPGSRGRTYFTDYGEVLDTRRAPDWMTIDARALSGKILNLTSTLGDIATADVVAFGDLNVSSAKDFLFGSITATVSPL